jgi:hypothetical protein
VTKWEYISVRFTYTGFGIKQEFHDLELNGKRIVTAGKGEEDVAKNLPDFLNMMGEDGWEMVSHEVEAAGSISHYMHFKRPKME